ncbi:MAG: hypothetical protein ACKVS6_06245 [Planctomycetota bacterium]
MNNVKRAFIFIVGIAAGAMVVWLSWATKDPGAAPSINSPDSKPATTQRAVETVKNGHREAADANTTDSDPEIDDGQPPVHLPGSGPIVPIDLTNIADEQLGKSLWMEFTNDTGKWTELWQAIHKHDGDRKNPLDDPPEPYPFRPALEGILAIGLGERERMDYTITLEPVVSKYGEARYRLKISTSPAPPVEVRSRPVRVWLVPLGNQLKNGLTIEDEHANEIKRFDPILPIVEATDDEER